MAEIIGLKSGCVPGEPDADIIEVCETLLERAKSGDLTGIAYATTSLNGEQGTGWCGVAGTRHTLGTSIMMLEHRYIAGLRGADD